MSLPLADARTAIQEWLRAEYINTAADIVVPQGDVGFWRCTYHQNVGKGPGVSLTLAETVVRVYLSRAHEDTGRKLADDAQSTLQESLESATGPWAQLVVATSDIAEETVGEATFEVVRLNVQIWL